MPPSHFLAPETVEAQETQDRPRVEDWTASSTSLVNQTSQVPTLFLYPDINNIPGEFGEVRPHAGYISIYIYIVITTVQ